MHYAIELGYRNLVRALLSNDKTDVNWKADLTGTPLGLAIDMGDETLVQPLLDDPRVIADKHGSFMRATPLHQAVKQRQAWAVRALLSDDRIDVNAGGRDGWTALHIAADSCESAEILLSDPRVDVNSRKHDGGTPLHVAALFNQLKVVRLLLSQDGIRPDIENNAGDSVRGFSEKGRYVDGINEAILAHGLSV
ncbi:ankyrin [Choiromyces venosus 120613-1]|uniref:Ankyrin n=1 Tax=Choiromyces venosus 120613-1 TaxID=1336337 RepID=A0A3N4JJX8_9PEZI|nr:ankyrin [Choiromyces venosus 120613-1]